jgi:hypothetical protein
MATIEGEAEGRKEEKNKSLYQVVFFSDWRREADLSADLYREQAVKC